MSKKPDRIVYSMNRREVLIKGFAGALAVAGFWSRSGTVFASVPGVTAGETPGLEEGPFWVDGQLQRSDVRLDTSTNTYAAGLPLTLALTLSQVSDTAPYTLTALVGARVDIWSANAQGVYSDEASENTPGENYLRGYQVSDANGTVRFVTIYPGWYSGRTPHIHIRVRTYDATGAETYNFATQLFFDDAVTAQVYAANAAYSRTQARDTTNSTDRVLNGASDNDSPPSEAGDYTMLTLTDSGTSASASFHIVLDLSDTANEDPTGGTETGGGGSGGTGGGGTGGGGSGGTGGGPGGGSGGGSKGGSGGGSGGGTGGSKGGGTTGSPGGSGGGTTGGPGGSSNGGKAGGTTAPTKGSSRSAFRRS